MSAEVDSIEVGTLSVLAEYGHSALHSGATRPVALTNALPNGSPGPQPAFRRCQRVVVPDCGHLPHLETPDQFNRTVSSSSPGSEGRRLSSRTNPTGST